MPVNANNINAVVRSDLESDTILKSLFNSLNENLFRNALNGIDLKWSTELKTRTAISLIGKTSNYRTQTFICMSKTLLANCTRKQLVESLLYEMVSVYIDSCKNKTDSDDEQSKNFQGLLKRAMEFLNQTAGTNLSFNYTLHAHHITDSFDEWIDIEEDINFHKFNNTVICISDDSDDEEDNFDYIRKTGYVSIEPVIGKINVQDIPDGCYTAFGMFTCCCCTDYDQLFKKCFKGTNFDLISGDTHLKSTQTCPICSQTIENDKLNAHLIQKCNLFHV